MDVELELELASALEDDLFYADLSKRISLLIMEDDHEEDFPQKGSEITPFWTYNYAPSQPSFTPSPQFYEGAYIRETKGTGVFIPNSSLPKKKNKNRSRKCDKTKTTSVPSSANIRNSHKSMQPSQCSQAIN